MHKIQFSLFLFLLSFSAVSQNTFFRWYPSDKYEYIVNAIISSDGNFILCGEHGDDAFSVVQAYLLKINQNGDVLKENIKADSGSSSSHCVIYTLSDEEGMFNTILSQNISRAGHYYNLQSFNKYSNNLELVSIRKYLSPVDKAIFPQAVLLVSDTCIFVQSEIVTQLPYFHIIGSLVTKYNLQNDSLCSFYKPGDYLFSFGLIADTDSLTLKSFSVNPGTFTYVSKLNTALQLLGEAKLPFFVTSTSATKFSDSKYLLTGVVDELINVKQHIIVRSYDKNDLPIDSVEYYNHPDSILYSGSVCNTAIVGDNVFIVGNYNINPAQWPWQNSPTWIQITRLDSNLHILDHHFYGGDAVYMPWKILSTTDGGAIVFGNRYDYKIPNEYKYHPFALKLNPYGLITELPEQPQAKAHDAIVYPNPGREWLNIQSGPQISGAAFTLYDMKGQPLLNQTLNSTQLKLNTAALPSGIYPWQIVFKNKVIESGKWIKE